MSVTENARNFFTTLTPNGVDDWSSETSFPKGMRVYCINFFPSATNDTLCLKEGGSDGPEIWKVKDVVGSGLTLYLPANLINPFLDASECVFGVTTNVRITFYQA